MRPARSDGSSTPALTTHNQRTNGIAAKPVNPSPPTTIRNPRQVRAADRRLPKRTGARPVSGSGAISLVGSGCVRWRRVRPGAADRWSYRIPDPEGVVAGVGCEVAATHSPVSESARMFQPLTTCMLEHSGDSAGRHRGVYASVREANSSSAVAAIAGRVLPRRQVLLVVAIPARR